MGLYFRKSVGFGPFRLNFSKSGVGASFGVRGARISTGPRGTYINAGRNGFYYRQRIDVPSPGDSPPSPHPLKVDTSDNKSRIKSADVAQRGCHTLVSSPSRNIGAHSTGTARARFQSDTVSSDCWRDSTRGTCLEGHSRKARADLYCLRERLRYFGWRFFDDRHRT